MTTPNWKKTTEAVPRTAVQMLCIDRKGEVLLIHRSPTVRSARDCWSFPSGLHDIGETLAETCSRELLEEFNLSAPPGAFVQLGTYENINGDPDAAEPWHWVVNTFAVIVDFQTLINNEPDKHDQIKFVNIDYFCSAVECHNFHASFKRWYFKRAHSVETVLRTMCQTMFNSPELGAHLPVPNED